MCDHGRLPGTAPDDRFRALYELIARHPFETMYPPDWRELRGAVDLHVHVGKERIDPIAQARHATRAGFRALVFKNSQLPTVEVARISTELTAEWAAQQDAPLQPVECYGGVVTGTPIGGINLEMVGHVLKLGGRMVWLPVLSSIAHLEHAMGLPHDEAVARGVPVLDANGRLLPVVAELVQRVAEADVILSFGHLSAREMYAVAESVDRLGFKKALIDHPFDPPLGLSVDDMYAFARIGVTLNFTFFEISQFCAVDPREMGTVIRNVDPDRVTISSDSCFQIFPDSVESMRIMGQTLKVLGISGADVQRFIAGNAYRLLGLA